MLATQRRFLRGRPDIDRRAARRHVCVASRAPASTVGGIGRAAAAAATAAAAAAAAAAAKRHIVDGWRQRPQAPRRRPPSRPLQRCSVDQLGDEARRRGRHSASGRSGRRRGRDRHCVRREEDGDEGVPGGGGADPILDTCQLSATGAPPARSATKDRAATAARKQTMCYNKHQCGQQAGTRPASKGASKSETQADSCSTHTDSGGTQARKPWQEVGGAGRSERWIAPLSPR